MKKFQLTVTFDDDVAASIESYNDGCTPLEILGILDVKRQDIFDQVNQPDRFKHKRTYVADGEEISIEEEEE